MIDKEQRDRLARTIAIAVEHWAAVEFDAPARHDVYLGHVQATIKVVVGDGDDADLATCEVTIR